MLKLPMGVLTPSLYALAVRMGYLALLNEYVGTEKLFSLSMIFFVTLIVR